MQPLSRDGLTDAQVTALLHADVEVSAGLELLRPNLTVAEDISGDLVGGSVQWSRDATIHGECTLTISRSLQWGNALLRPYMTLTGVGVTARFNLGVYMALAPLTAYGEDPRAYEVHCMNRLYLLDRQVGADYTVNQGLTYRAALTTAFANSGLSGFFIDGAAADSIVPKTRVWTLIGDDQANPDQTDTPATWLRIINDLLRAIDFEAVWADENGVFHCRAAVDPKDRRSDFTFDADADDSIVEQDRTLEEDAYKTPNRWVFRWTNAPDGTATGDLTYERTLPDADPMSAASRGLVWTQVIDYEAASRLLFTRLGDRRVAADRRRAVKFDLSTGCFPVAGHRDVLTYRDSQAGTFKVIATSWETPLNGSATRWTWEAVT